MPKMVEVKIEFVSNEDMADIIEIADEINLHCQCADDIYKKLYKSLIKFIKEFIKENVKHSVEKITDNVIDIINALDDEIYRIARVISMGANCKCEARYNITSLNDISLEKATKLIYNLCKQGKITGCDSVKKAIETFYS